MTNNNAQLRVIALELMHKRFDFITLDLRQVSLCANDIGYKFGLSDLKRAWGRCSYGRKTIELSSFLYNQEGAFKEEFIRDTMLHEIAHAFSVHLYGMSEGRGHGKNWKHTAKAIGCDGSRAHDAFDRSVKVVSKYTLYCPVCHYKAARHRKPKGQTSCGRCCNKYNPDFELLIKMNY